MLLQPIPGGTELAVIAVIALIPLAILYALFQVARQFLAGRDRVDELERQLGRLDRRVEELEGDDGPGRTERPSEPGAEGGSAERD